MIWDSIYFFCLITFTLLASAHRSPLLGFFAASSLFSLLGFLVFPVCLNLDAEEDWTTLHLLCASGVITVFMLLLGIAKNLRPVGGRLGKFISNVDFLVSPYRIGLSCFGCLALLSSGLYWVRDDDQSGFYFELNALYIFLDLLLIGAGTLLGDDSFRNSGATFFVIWVFAKIFEQFNISMWVVYLAMSVLLVAAAHFLKTNRCWLEGMFGGLTRPEPRRQPDLTPRALLEEL